MPATSPAEIHDLFRDAYNTGDLDTVVALYEPAAVLVTEGRHLVGHQAIRQAFQNFFQRRARMTIHTVAVIQSDNVAILHGAWVLEPIVAGSAELTTRGLSTELVRRQSDGAWLFAIDSPYTPIPTRLPVNPEGE